ncbi:pyridoxal phosphate-dependent aminotransferase [Mesoterricola sediminis]|uniref:histidinol-phosphate transaminase n=1 Tax=Mesoterricola sediminis TaxID=2927980 RepID=A0AA48KCA3_9BACT|nr:aminotransferase class I/II-fold pyridoxal phosphate-dependent enzyme [Mesoterricola sediminis]BDU75860.1 histidinol-phosphate aminotransferase [Mesoterricola sediminis]
MSAAYATREGRGAFVRMDFNEGPPPPAPLLAADLAGALAMYPEYGPLKEAAARAWGVDPARIVPVNGADEGIFLALRLLGGGGLALPVPAFSMYRVYADQLGIPVAEAPMGPDFEVDVDALLAAPGSVVALTTPNNPTGRALPAGAVERVLAQGRTVLLDETYGAFCGQDFAPLLERWPNLVLLRTLSKAYGVPGLRCGFILASPARAGELDALRSPFNVNAAAVVLGARLLAEDRTFPDRVAGAVAARARVQDGLRAAGYATFPSDAHFFLARLEPGAAGRLAAAGILIKDYPALGEGMVRISVPGPAEAEAFEAAFLKGRP